MNRYELYTKLADLCSEIAKVEKNPDLARFYMNAKQGFKIKALRLKIDEVV